MTVVVNTKYTKIRFVDQWENSQPLRYTSIDLAYSEKADPMALLFSINMDQTLQNELRKRLADKLCVDPKRDIAVEDMWIMVQGYDDDTKHHTTEIIAIVKEAEAEFDRMLA
jgi:hypothetical protein